MMIKCPECKRNMKSPWVLKGQLILHAECKYCDLSWDQAIDLSNMEVSSTKKDALSDVYFG